MPPDPKTHQSNPRISGRLGSQGQVIHIVRPCRRTGARQPDIEGKLLRGGSHIVKPSRLHPGWTEVSRRDSRQDLENLVPGGVADVVGDGAARVRRRSLAPSAEQVTLVRHEGDGLAEPGLEGGAAGRVGDGGSLQATMRVGAVGEVVCQNPRGGVLDCPITPGLEAAVGDAGWR